MGKGDAVQDSDEEGRCRDAKIDEVYTAMASRECKEETATTYHGCSSRNKLLGNNRRSEVFTKQLMIRINDNNVNNYLSVGVT